MGGQGAPRWEGACQRGLTGGEGIRPLDTWGKNVPAEGIISAKARRWEFEQQQGA